MNMNFHNSIFCNVDNKPTKTMIWLRHMTYTFWSSACIRGNFIALSCWTWWVVILNTWIIFLQSTHTCFSLSNCRFCKQNFNFRWKKLKLKMQSDKHDHVIVNIMYTDVMLYIRTKWQMGMSCFMLNFFKWLIYLQKEPKEATINNNFPS